MKLAKVCLTCWLWKQLHSSSWHCSQWKFVWCRQQNQRTARHVSNIDRRHRMPTCDDLQLPSSIRRTDICPSNSKAWDRLTPLFRPLHTGTIFLWYGFSHDDFSTQWCYRSLSFLTHRRLKVLMDRQKARLGRWNPRTSQLFYGLIFTAFELRVVAIGRRI